MLMAVNTGNEWFGYLWREVRTNKTSGSFGKKRQSEYDSAEIFAGIVLLGPSGGWQLTTVLIYYLILPPPSDEVIMQYKLLLGPRP